jgi:hypothetical protein
VPDRYRASACWAGAGASAESFHGGQHGAVEDEEDRGGDGFAEAAAYGVFQGEAGQPVRDGRDDE